MQPNEFLLALEAERHDLSWKNPRKFTHQPQVITYTKPDAERERKMFNAGRYAAGARDRVATSANRWLARELNK